MIGYIKGKIIDIEPGAVVVDVNGVGYLVNFAGEAQLPGNEIEMFVHTTVRENDISLWGFVNREQKQLFELLLGVSGVGAKTAMAIVAEKGVGNVIKAIQLDSPDQLKVSGVGKKTAERIIIDLQGKIDQFSLSSAQSIEGEDGRNEELAEVTTALESLGYYRQDIQKVLDGIPSKDRAQMTTEELIKHVIKSI